MMNLGWTKNMLSFWQLELKGSINLYLESRRVGAFHGLVLEQGEAGNFHGWNRDSEILCWRCLRNASPS